MSLCDSGSGVLYILKDTGWGGCTVCVWGHLKEKQWSASSCSCFCPSSWQLDDSSQHRRIHTLISTTLPLSLSVFPIISQTHSYWPEESRLPLLPLIILPLLPMLASLEVFKVPVSVRSIAISLKLRAAWIFDCVHKNEKGFLLLN